MEKRVAPPAAGSSWPLPPHPGAPGWDDPYYPACPDAARPALPLFCYL
jgi:hypothetical protein